MAGTVKAAEKPNVYSKSKPYSGKLFASYWSEMQGAEVSDGARSVSEMVSAPRPQLISELIREDRAKPQQPGQAWCCL